MKEHTVEEQVRDLLWSALRVGGRIEREAICQYLRDSGFHIASNFAADIELELHEPARAYARATWFGWNKEDNPPTEKT